MNHRTVLAALVVAALGLTGCGSGAPDYNTITCKEYLDLVAKDGISTGGALDVAKDMLDSTSIDPQGGVSDVADFADTISGVCGPTRLGDTKIIDHRAQVVSVFLSVHPDDAP